MRNNRTLSRWELAWRPIIIDALPLLSLALLTILCKLPTIGTPAYWDEMGYLAQAEWLSKRNLVEAIPGLRPADAFWGHPPGLHLTLALVGRVFGVSVTIAHALIACFSALGVVATYLLARRFYGSAPAWLAALLVLLSPLYFAQSGMFLADLPVAALGALVMYFALADRYGAYVVCASCMVLVKETAIALVVAVLLYRFLIVSPLRKAQLREVAKYSVPLIVIGAFIVVQKITTGEFFFIYEDDLKLFDLSPGLVRRRFIMITRWIFIEQQRFVFTGLIGLNLLVNAHARQRRELWLFMFVVVLSGYSFSVLFLLPRYLLPILPLFYILGAAAVFDLARKPALQLTAAGGLLSMMVWSLIAQPFTGNGEQSLRYLDVVAMNKTAADRIASQFPDALVLTTWPHTDELAQPLHAYVRQPVATRTFGQPVDLDGSDLVLVSQPSGENATELRESALSRGWHLIVRLERGGAWTELYASPSRPSPGPR